ncbi:hypothetical protein PT276_05690 [Orbaceae bacterium ESL0721]|nr:hypothetical protein [Orbaceae bacterium ESL0721]
MMIEPISWQWQNSIKPQHVCAALAWYENCLTLVNYLLHQVDEHQYNQLQIATHRDLIILIGREELLPWFDGILYAGYDDIEPRLWRPSHKIPQIPLPLLADSLCRHYQQTPLLIWDSPTVVIPFIQAQLVDKILLQTLLNDLGKKPYDKVE